MPTNLAIDDKLLDRAVKVGGLRTKKDTVNLALKEFIDRRRQKELLKCVGQFDFRKDWDYRKDRGRGERSR